MPEPANAKTANAPPAKTDAAPSAPWAVPSVSSAVPTKEHQTRTVALNDVGGACLPK